MLTNNIIINPSGKNNVTVLIKDPSTTYLFSENIYSNSNNSFKGFTAVKAEKLSKQNGFILALINPDVNMQNLIFSRLAVHNITLTEKDMTLFDIAWKLKKQSVWVTWMK